MGCNIHTVWQKKVGDSWVDIESEYEENRHYALFAVLAGVRNGVHHWVKNGYFVTPIAEPRGFPKDFDVLDGDMHKTDIVPKWMDTERFEGEVWMGDHSYSWLSGEEMLKWYDDKQDLAYFFEEVANLQNKYVEIRVVFGFDN